jgi:hypothetical protein
VCLAASGNNLYAYNVIVLEELENIIAWQITGTEELLENEDLTSWASRMQRQQ